jgi:hypothetical protein
VIITGCSDFVRAAPQIWQDRCLFFVWTFIIGVTKCPSRRFQGGGIRRSCRIRQKDSSAAYQIDVGGNPLTSHGKSLTVSSIFHEI